MDFVCFVCLQTRNPSVGLQKHENKRFFLKSGWLGVLVGCLFAVTSICLCVCVYVSVFVYQT